MTWWRHQKETFSALLAICAGNSPVPGEFPTQRQVTRSFDVYFDLRPNKWLSKQSWGWWFETLSCSFWRHRNEMSVSDLCFPIDNCYFEEDCRPCVVATILRAPTKIVNSNFPHTNCSIAWRLQTFDNEMFVKNQRQSYYLSPTRDCEGILTWNLSCASWIFILNFF